VLTDADESGEQIDGILADERIKWIHIITSAPIVVAVGNCANRDQQSTG
jgi:hypothetical protein